MHLNNQLWFTRDMLILSLSVLVGFEFIRSVLADAWIHMENIQQNPRTVLQFQEQMMERIGQYQQGVAKRHEEKTRSFRTREPKEGLDALLFKYPELTPEGPLQLTIRVDLVLMGFESDDAGDLDNFNSALDSWLEHLPSVLRHATVQQHGPLSSQGDGDDEDGLPLPRREEPEIEYVYEFRVVDVGIDPMQTIQDVMRRHLRKDDVKTADNISPSTRRDVGINDSDNMLYMAAYEMEEPLKSLLLKLATARSEGSEMNESVTKMPPAFTLFLLNPNRDSVNSEGHLEHMTYGYRSWLSPRHMAALATKEEVVHEVNRVNQLGKKRDTMLHHKTMERLLKRKVGISNREKSEKNTRPRLPLEDMAKVGRQWASTYDQRNPTDTKEGWTLEKESQRLLRNDPRDVRARQNLGDVLDYTSRTQRDKYTADTDEFGANSGGFGSTTECLTEAWVSRERFAWLDVQAGPFGWGRAYKGAGYKAASPGIIPRHLLPQATLNGGLTDNSEARQEDTHYKISVDKLAKKVTARIGRLETLAMQMGCNPDGGMDPSSLRRRRRLSVATISCEEVDIQLQFLERFKDEGAQFVAKAEAWVTNFRGSKSAQEEDMLLLEKVRANYLKILAEILETVAPATEGDAVDVASALDSGTQMLLARLAALVSSLARGVVTPVSLLPLPEPVPDVLATHLSLLVSEHSDEPGEGSDLTTTVALESETVLNINAVENQRVKALPYRLPTGPSLARFGSGFRSDYKSDSGSGSRSEIGGAYPLLLPSPPSALDFFVPENVAFTLYIVSSPLGDTGDESTGEDGEDSENSEGTHPGFDLQAFSHEALSLTLPNQKASFTVVHNINKNDNDKLVAALAGATRESNVNVREDRRETRIEQRTWVDSEVLYRQLEPFAPQDKHGSQQSMTEKARQTTQDVSIFLFKFTGPQSVYVDELWRARAVGGDTVIIAQSGSSRNTSPLYTCGGSPFGEDPRNPLREALAALGRIMGGLRPSHDSWDEARGEVMQDWMWSMSESPMSPFMRRATFSELDKDIVYRTHVVRALSASVQLTRAASSFLRRALSREKSRIYIRHKSEDLRAALKQLQEVCYRRENIVSYMDRLDFASAMQDINLLLDESQSAYKQSHQLALEALEAVLSVLDASGDTQTRAEEDSPSWSRLVLACGFLAFAMWTLRRVTVVPVGTGSSRYQMRGIRVN